MNKKMKTKRGLDRRTEKMKIFKNRKGFAAREKSERMTKKRKDSREK